MPRTAPAASRGKPSLSIKALSLHTPSGEVLDFTASVIDTATPHKLDVDQEGRVRGAAFSPMDKVEMGSLAGVGLVAGAVIAGPEGLFIGTASGAALAAGHIVVKHRNLTLPAGTELIFELDGPATISHPQMGGLTSVAEAKQSCDVKMPSGPSIQPEISAPHRRRRLHFERCHLFRIRYFTTPLSASKNSGNDTATASAP